MKRIVFFLLFAAFHILSQAQSVGVGTSTPDPSAAIEVSSTTQGMLVPRMTSTQREMIANPATGLLVFDITTNSFWFRDVSAWTELVTSGNTEVHRNGPDMIYMGLTDSVGVGTSDPAYKFQVQTGNNQYGISHTNGEVDLATYVHNTIGGWIGTRSNHSFNLYAGDGGNQFTLLPNGNIGLGTANPVTKLHVVGHTNMVGNHYINGSIFMDGAPNNRLDIVHDVPRSGSHPDDRALYVTGDFGSNSGGIEFRHANGTQGIGFGYNTIYAAGNNISQDLGLAAKGVDGKMLFTTGNLERMRLTADGKVGIGTTTPNAPLQFSNATGRKIVLYEVVNNDHKYFGFGVNADGSFRYQTPVNVNDHVFFSAASDTSSNELMRIKGTGNVGIGLNPVNRLDIHNGAARTGSHPVGRPLYATGNLSGPGSGIEFRHSNGGQGIGFGLNTIYAAGSDGVQDLGFWAKGASGNLLFSTDNMERMRITGTGHIGIGTNAPNAPLQMANTLQNRKMVLYELNNNDHQFSGLGVDADGLRYQVKSSADDHTFYAAISPTTSHEVMRIKGDGNVTVRGIIESEPWIQATLGPNWSHAPDDPVKYYKDKLGRVYFQGTAHAGATPNFTELFTMPVGYRPDELILLILQLSGNNYDADLVIDVDGFTYANYAIPGAYYSLSNVSYRAN